MLLSVARLVGFAAALAPFAAAIDTITVKGRHFVNSRTGENVFDPVAGHDANSSFGSRAQTYVFLVPFKQARLN
jgi:hypothetical protein